MNSDMNDAQNSAKIETVPAALADIHHRLLEDGAVWRDELPLELARSPQMLHETAPQRPTTYSSRQMLVTKRPLHAPRRAASGARRLIASAAILVVVGLLATLFATFANNRIGAHLTSGGHNPSPTVESFVRTPGPAANYIVMVMTARAVDNNFTPIDITSRFPVSAQVHLFVQVRNVNAGEKHTVSVRWYLNGVEMQENDGLGRTSVEVRDNSNVHFALVYSTAGVGMAKVYWDRPPDDTSDSDTDRSLAQTIFFTIEPQS